MVMGHAEIELIAESREPRAESREPRAERRELRAEGCQLFADRVPTPTP